MKNKINSWKSAVTKGFKFGSLSFLLLVLYTCCLHYFVLKGESYIGKAETVDFINGVPFLAVNIMIGIIATIIPILFLRYSKLRFMLLNLLISSCMYLLLYIVCLLCGEIVSFGLLYPMEGFDAIIYSLISFPIGSALGTIVAIIINTVISKNLIE